MNLEIYLTFVLAATLLIIIPGPTLITIMSNGISHGIKKGILTIIGATLAHSVYILITAMGMSEVLALSLEYFVIVKWIGVCYLIATGGYKLLMLDKKTKNSGFKIKNKSTLLFQGFLVTISNPKAIIFYAAFFPPFLNINEHLFPQYILLGGTFLIIFIVLSLTSSIFAKKFSGFLVKQNERLTERISGFMMILAGLILSTVKGNK